MRTHQTKKNWENSSLANMPHNGRLSSSIIPAHHLKSSALIRIDRRMTIDELTSELVVSHGSADNIIKSL